MARSDIGLSDLLYSIERLSIRDPGTLQTVQRMLKLETVERSDSRMAIEPVAPDVHPPLSDTQPASAALNSSLTADTGVTGRVPMIRQASLFPVVDPPVTAPQLPAWYAEVSSLQRGTNSRQTASLSRPLFPVRQTRALLSAALSTWGEDGSLDIPGIIEILARAQPVRSWPQLSIPTLRRGCQILIDDAIAMAPFRLDVEHLIVQVSAVVATDRIAIRRFVGCPLRASWKAPASGTPILLLTDLGIGGPPLNEDRAGIKEWLDFAKLAQGSDCPVVALVPYAPSRWPRAFSGRINVIHWDRRTTAARIRKRAMTGRRVL